MRQMYDVVCLFFKLTRLFLRNFVERIGEEIRAFIPNNHSSKYQSLFDILHVSTLTFSFMTPISSFSVPPWFIQVGLMKSAYFLLLMCDELLVSLGA